MKYVYVLTSTTKDLYYEQALMSVYSLKLHNPSAHVVVLVDDKTQATFTAENKRAALAQYATEIIAVPFADDVPNVDRSRLIKTAIPEYVSGSFLYIDCDTIIADDLSGIERVEATTGGILDGHCRLNEHIHQKYFLSRDKKLGFHGTSALGGNINGGVILAKADTEAEKAQSVALFKAWNEAWKYARTKSTISTTRAH